MVEFTCPRCCYNINYRSSMISHLNKKKLCELKGLDIIPNNYRDIILRDIDTTEVITMMCSDNEMKKHENEIEKYKEELKGVEDLKKEIIKLREENEKLKHQILKDTKGGYIYVLHNPAFEMYGDNVYKIGCSLDPRKRKKDFSTMYVSASTIVYVSPKFPNKLQAERKLFELMKEYRFVGNREFFDLELDKIIENVKKIK